VLDCDAHGRKATIAPFLSLRQFPAFWLLVGNLQHRTEIARVSFLLHTLRQKNASLVVHFFVVRASVECRGHRCNAYFSLLLVPMLSRFFALPYDDNLVLNRVMLLLAAVPLALSARRPIRRLFRSIEKRRQNFVFYNFDTSFWNAENACEQGLQWINITSHISVVDSEDETEKDMRDVDTVTSAASAIDPLKEARTAYRLRSCAFGLSN